MIPELLTIEPVAWLLRGALLLAGVWLGAAGLRRKSPGWRALVWRCGLVGLLATVPLVVLGWRTVVPGKAPAMAQRAVEEAVPIEVGETTSQWDSTTEGTVSVIDAAAVAEGGMVGRDSKLTETSRGSIDWTAVLWAVWGAGACWVLLRWSRSLWRRWHWERRATNLDQEVSWQWLLEEVAGAGARVRLLAHDDVSVPCAWGIWRPTILLPAAAGDWPLDHRRLALAHEWAHLRRRDPFWQALSVLALTLHWANPLVWVMRRRWRLAEEEVADDWASAHAEAESYATLLVACARSMQSESGVVPASSSMAHPSTVPERVRRVLDAGRDRRTSGARQRALAVVAVVGLIGGIAFLTPELVALEVTPTPMETTPAPDAGEGDAPPVVPSTSSAPAPSIDPSGPATAPAAGSTAALTSTIEEKLRSIVIPRIVFEDAPLEEAIEFLRLKSKELDTSTKDRHARGVNFILHLTEEMRRKKVTFDLTDVPLGVAVQALSRHAAVGRRVEPFAVIISDAVTDANTLYTKVFRVPPDFLNLAGGALVETGALSPKPTAIDILKRAGIDFPEMSSAFFNPATSTLTVRNTVNALDQVEQFAKAINPGKRRMINVRAYLYRLPKADALEVAESLDNALDATDAVKRLRRQATAGGSAVLLAAPSVHTRSGERVRSRVARRHPASADEASAPTDPAGATATPEPPINPFENREETGRQLAAQEGDGVEPGEDFPFLGCLWEVEPVLGADGQTLDVSASVTYSAPPRATGDRPLLGTLTTSTTLFAGQIRLLGTLSGGEDESSMILVFLKADVATSP